MPPAADPQLLGRLAGVATSTLGHWRLWGSCHRDIQPLSPGVRVAGTAVTLALPGADSALLHRAVGWLRPGDILMIDRLSDRRHACIGGVTALAAKLRGAAGLVVDGPCTDVEEVRATGLPVWCAGVSAVTTQPLGLGGRMNASVSVGGAVVHAGDVVLCDDSGVMVLSPDEAARDAERATGRLVREATLLEGLRAGGRLENLSRAELLLPTPISGEECAR
jgi:regulator of RNase E activity RraA